MRRWCFNAIILFQMSGLLFLMPVVGVSQKADSVTNPVVKNTGQLSSVWQLPLIEFMQRSEKMPATILGGCVSITEGALSISVMIMALEVTKSHENNSERKNIMNDFIDSLKSMQDSLTVLADNDRQLFKQFLLVSHLPDSTTEEKHLKDYETYQALLEATKSPVESARIMLQALRIMSRSIIYCSPVTLSDGAASSSLLEGSLQAILLIADPDILELNMHDKTKFVMLRNRYSEQASLLLKYIKEYLVKTEINKPLK